MRGRIWVNSEEGSTFWFTATFRRATERDVPAAVEPGAVVRSRHIRPLLILLAEDNPVNQRLTLRLLERNGHKVKVARDGREAAALSLPGHSV